MHQFICPDKGGCRALQVIVHKWNDGLEYLHRCRECHEIEFGNRKYFRHEGLSDFTYLFISICVRNQVMNKCDMKRMHTYINNIRMKCVAIYMNENDENILVEDENTIYEIDSECLKKHKKENVKK